MKDFFRPIAALSAEDRGEFISHSHGNAKQAIPTFMTIGCIAYSLFIFYDMICLPHLWKQFLVLRIFLVVPTMIYVWAIRGGKVPFGVHSKLLLCVPSVIGTTYMVSVVPRDFFVLETCTEVLQILCTAVLFPWLPNEFFKYALLSLGGSALIWHGIGNLTLSELTLEYAVFLTTFVASLLTVLIHTNQAIQLFQTNKQLIRNEISKLEIKIGSIESRLAESDRNAYLAHHLGLFLHEIKNILLSLDIISDSQFSEPEEISFIHSTIKTSSDLARKRIEAFLAKIKVQSDQKQVLSVAQELQTALPIIRHDAKKNNITVDYSSPQDLESFRAFAVPGAIAVVLFDISRNAVSAIAEARRMFPGPTFSGRIEISVSVTEDSVCLVIHDNGIGVSEELSAAFDAGEKIESSNSPRAGIGTLGMRHEARENRFQISLKPRLGGGTTATLVVPRYRMELSREVSGEVRRLA
jgi:signal transduction histidine kinase